MPNLQGPIGLAVTGNTQGNEIHWIVIKLIVVYMMNVKCTGIVLMSKTILTGKIISFSDLMSKWGAKLFGIANIKPVSAFAGKGYAIGTIHSIVSTIYKAHGFRNRITAAVTGDGDCVVMPVVTALPPADFRRIFTFALLIAEIDFRPVRLAWDSIRFLSAIGTGNDNSRRFRPMAWGKISNPTPIIIHIKCLTASALTVYKLISGRDCLIGGYI